MRSVLAFVLLLVGVITYSTSAHAQGSPGSDQKAARISLVREFVREMELLYRLQETAKKEFAEAPSSSAQIATSVRVGTRTLLQINDSINRLNMINNLDKTWGGFKDLLKQLNEQRMQYVTEMVQMSKAMLSGPTPGVNYGAMSARAPELTAYIEDLDKSVFKMSQAMFFALVDERRVGADGNLHHLLLTKKERASMVQSIETSFGPVLEDKNASHVVLAAWAIKYGLTRPNYKSSDEP